MKQIRLVKIKQVFPAPSIADVSGTVLRELDRAGLGRKVGLPARLAITAGSRGIKDIVVILGAVAGAVKAAGAEPFIVAAMGSHGGGTSAGQKQVLDSLGITEEAVGCPVHVSDEVVEIGCTT